MIKAIFFDVDGTLLSHRTGRISPHTRACIRALRAGGTLVFLSTGRHHSGAAEPPGGGDGV